MAWIVLGSVIALLAWYLWERSRRQTHAVNAGLNQRVNLPHSQEWELYHNDFSLCSKKTRVCLAEFNINHRAHHIDLIETGSYQNISRAFLQVNPSAVVPVLVHNGHPIYESHEQLKYVAAHCGQDHLLVPEDAEKRALMDHWVHLTSLVGDDPIAGMEKTAGNAVPGLTLPIFAAMIEDIPVVRILEGLLFHRIKQRALFFLAMKVRGLSKLPQTKPMVAVIKRSRHAMHKHLDQLETTLQASAAEGPWIVGAQFSLADVGMMVILDRLDEVDWLDVFLTDKRPHVQAYWTALQARPSFAKAITQHTHHTVTRGRAKVVQQKSQDPSFYSALVLDD